ncbi:MAG: hypothetical protein KDK41_10115 [Leptospiraceae bacterium]|nr:hypothetical protein [Leptospiraceae bacterium]
MKTFICAFLLLFSSMQARQLRVFAGTLNTNEQLRGFGASEFNAQNLNAGVMKVESETRVYAEFSSQFSETHLQAGTLSTQLDEGLILSNGGYLPGFSSLPNKRPITAQFGQSFGLAMITAYTAINENKDQISSYQLAILPSGFLNLRAGALQLERDQNRNWYPLADVRLNFKGLGSWQFFSTWTGQGLADFQKSPATSMGLKYNSNGQNVKLMYFESNRNPFAAGFYSDHRKAVTLNIRLGEKEIWQLSGASRSDGKNHRTRHILSVYQVNLFHLYRQNNFHFTGIGILPGEGFGPVGAFYFQQHSRLASIGWGYSRIFRMAIFASRNLEFGSPADPIFFRGMNFESLNEDRVFSLSGNVIGAQLLASYDFFSCYAMAGKTQDQSQPFLVSLRFSLSYTF